MLIAVVHRHPDKVMAALLLATLGNTLGGMTTYGMARLLPERVGADGTVMKRLDALRKHGGPLLLLAWAPVIGDA
ncbi:MAG: DedA family protein, partial [Rhodocyclales bacterium]|nr:DedA family protein [Rhodocyclales bacterium]